MSSECGSDWEFEEHRCIVCNDDIKHIGKSMWRCGVCEGFMCQGHTGEWRIGCYLDDEASVCKDCFDDIEGEDRYCQDEECECGNPSPDAKKKQDSAKWREEQHRAIEREIVEKEKIDRVIFPDGKYGGKPVTDADRKYIEWCAIQDKASALKYAKKKGQSQQYADDWFLRWKPCIDAAKKLVKLQRRFEKFEQMMKDADEFADDPGFSSLEEDIQEFLINHPEYKDWYCKESKRRDEEKKRLVAVE